MIDPVLDTTLIDPTGIGLTPAVVVAFVLSVATLLSIVGNRRGLASGAAGIGRVLVLPILVATLLYFTLLPPTTAPAPTRFELLTEGADQAAIRSHWPRFALPEAWSLSERDPEIVRVVDLAAALRMQPTAVAIGIHGHGLGPRDLDAAQGLALEWTPPARPPGVVELDYPDPISAGRPWLLSGRIAGLDRARIELRDLGDRVVASSEIELGAGHDTDTHGDSGDRAQSGSGRFRLRVPAAATARGLYRLDLLEPDPAGGQPRLVERLPVPVRLLHGPPLRLLFLAGASNPELKYLRRWAIDAGLSVDARIGLTRGAVIGAGPGRLDAERLRDYDLAVLDERAWGRLTASERQALLEAIDLGLGVVLRLTGPVPAHVERDLASLGITLIADDGPQTVRLVGHDARADTGGDALGASRPDDPERGLDGSSRADARLVSERPASERPIELTRRPITVSADDTVVALRSTTGQALALWRPQRAGRFGLIWLSDSHRLVLAGQAERHAALWSEFLSSLARPIGPAEPRWQSRWHWRDRRSVLCGLDARQNAVVEPADVAMVAVATVADLDRADLDPVAGSRIDAPGRPSEARQALLIDPASGTAGCAGFWPATSGWQRLRISPVGDSPDREPIADGAGEVGDGAVADPDHADSLSQEFYVHEPDAASGIRRELDRIATRRHSVTGPSHGQVTASPLPAPGAATRWPWLLAWLAASAVLWWLERSSDQDRRRTAPTH